MRKLISMFMAAAAAVALSSCAQEEFDDYRPEPTGETITYIAEHAADEAAPGDSADSKAVMNPETKKSEWVKGDRITVHNGAAGFIFTTQDAGASAQFSYTGDDFSAENGVIAVYPAEEVGKDQEPVINADLAAKKVSVVIPGEQTATAGSYDPEAGVAVAYSTDEHLRFKNATALLKFTVATEGVKSVVFKGLDSEAVCGTADVAFAAEDNTVAGVTLRAEEAGTSVSLTAKDKFEVGKTYYMAIAPQTFSKGFTLSFQFVEEGPLHVVKSHEQSREIRRNVILNVGELTFDIYAGLSKTETPVLKSFQFDVANNPGKILPGQVKNGTKYEADARTFEKCDIKDGVVSAMIPYLNNRKLVPTFKVADGTRLVYEGGIIESGRTVVDFLKYKQIKVINGNKEEAVYEVQLTNTGLPVVVVNQVTNIQTSYVEDGKKVNTMSLVTSTTDGTQKGSAEWYKLTGTAWQPKGCDWIMSEDGSDNFMAYYADGTPGLTDKKGVEMVSEPVMASTRVRGNVSQQMPKKPFAVKLDSKSGVLGMPPHKRWVLLANWSDRTLMRNAIAFETAKYFHDNLSDGLLWNPSGQFVELVYNGVHVGNYYLCEQIKIDENRLDITDPYEKDDVYSGNPGDYGYLLECDDAYDETVKFTTKHYIPFMFKDDADAGGKMLEYARNLVCSVEDKLCAGSYSDAYNTLDITSMVDYLLINEVMMNGEIWNPKSAYMYIDNGKLYAGPIWDFDWQTIPNISVIESNFDTAWTNNGGVASYDFTYDKSMIAAAEKTKYIWGVIPSGTEIVMYHTSNLPSAPLDGSDRNFLWYPMLVKDGTFTAKAYERWSSIISAGLLSHITSFIDETAAEISVSQAINWSMWSFEASDTGRHDAYNVGGGFKGDEFEDFTGAVSLLKTNYGNRVNGMNGFITADGSKWPKLKYQNK